MSVDVIIVGAGLAGSVLAWTLHWQGLSVMLLDRNDTMTASKAAAGLLTPITGKRLTKTENYEELFASAQDFYRRVEQQTSSGLLQLQPAVRFFVSEAERDWFQQRRQAEYSSLVKMIADMSGNVVGFEMQSSGRLHVTDFLQVTREYFVARHQFRSADINVDTDVELTDDEAEISAYGLKSRFIVLCQGFQQRCSRWFPDVPNSPARGDILRVRISGYHEQRIVHQGIWLVPDKDQTYLLGATYDWKNLSNEPSSAGREELLQRLRQVTSQPVEVLEHKSAVRPGMKNCRPVAQTHANQKRLAVFNGLGTRGVLWAPSAAKQLASLIQTIPEKDHSKEDDPGRGGKRISLTNYVHRILDSIIQPGDQVIDATAGNGYDTLFLARKVGPTGKVSAFDVQQTAIDITRRRLLEHQIDYVELLHRSHEFLNEAAEPQTVTAITFNLGYLPGADRKVLTSAQQTLTALNHALSLLRAEGVLTVVSYRGHSGGMEETAAVEHRFQQLKAEDFSMQRLEADRGNPASPVLFIVRRVGI